MSPAPAVPRVSAVVITYNGRELLERMLPTLFAQRYDDFEAIVVDDGSSDGTVAFLGERWPQVRVVASASNRGVAAALNLGVQTARGEHVALLNNDLELDPEWLQVLVSSLERHPEAASATGKLLDFRRRDLIEAAGDVMRWSGMSGHRCHGERDGAARQEPMPVFSPSAGASLYRRGALERVGPFDEDFFAYLEDVDWGFRAQLAGFAARYEPAAIAYHMGGATTGRQVGRFTALQRRNSVLVVIKDYPLSALGRHLPKIVGYQLALLAASARDGLLRAHLRGLLQVARMLVPVLRKRRAIQRARKVSVAQLDALMTPEVYEATSARARVRALASAAAPLLGRRRAGR